MKAEMYDEGDSVILVKISDVGVKPASLIVDLINKEICKKEVKFNPSNEDLLRLLAYKLKQNKDEQE